MIEEKFICPVCGIEFIPCESSLYRFKNGKRKTLFCSQECSNLGNRKRITVECVNCGKKIERTPHEISPNNFCSKSCAATYNNKIRHVKANGYSNSVKNPNFKPLPTIKCENCGTDFKARTEKSKFCCVDCSNSFKRNEKIKNWKKGTYSGLSGYSLARPIRNYLLEKHNNACENCGFSGVNPFTGNSILEVHHKDGDYTNNKEENLQVLCPNCHAMTETYKARNKNGRKERSKYKLVYGKH